MACKKKVSIFDKHNDLFDELDELYYFFKKLNFPLSDKAADKKFSDMEAKLDTIKHFWTSPLYDKQRNIFTNTKEMWYGGDDDY